MDMNDLRAEALRRASDDCRTSMGTQTFQGAPEAVVTRAKAYLEFLLGTARSSPPKVAKRKKARS